MRCLAIVTICLLASPGLSVAQSLTQLVQAAETRSLIALAAQSPAGPSYAELRAQAIRENKPLLILIGYYSIDILERDVPGCLYYHSGNFFGDVEPGLIVSVPRYGNLWNCGRVNPNSTPEWIRKKMRETWLSVPDPNAKPWRIEDREPPNTFVPAAPMRSGGRSC